MDNQVEVQKLMEIHKQTQELLQQIHILEKKVKKQQEELQNIKNKKENLPNE